ncbi:30S ribosome-binding factor RbfA [Pseudoramibacter alactolyticus]|uniref:30S ribosome-binding factor RbfA n=1 Tax=Pseudoramibacter alactolyticus TaxID=113287 RepID=UPI0023564CC3|nr:30S ribosome-binding factor RbfA [Pseudoramibacter alactolyticus]MBM6967577.1 30S ribosome-binding factor RbfA [Pseudoramibacter alactolyticus]
MASHRKEKIDAQIQRELSLIIRQKTKDKRLHNNTLSITGVKATPDLKAATVYISVLGSEEDAQGVMEALEKAKGFLRSSLGKIMKTHMIPELHFKRDESVAYGMHIDAILNELHQQESEKA